jgi:RNA-directed DNA polymerase
MYTTPLYDRWVERERKNYDTKTRRYRKKGYKHFDPKIFFPDYIEDYRVKFSNPRKIFEWSYLPLIKVVSSTPRYRYDDSIDKMAIKFKDRPLAYAGHGDALLYSFAAFYLNEKYEERIKVLGISECVYAYRSLDHKNNIDFAKEVFDFIKAKGPCKAIALDITGFFDNLNHKILLSSWKQIVGGRLPEEQLRIFSSVTKYSYVNRNTALNHLRLNLRKYSRKIGNLCSDEEFRTIIRVENLIHVNENDFGIPQGLPISAVLSNIYMMDFDKKIFELLNLYGGLYRRYCDDIIIVCSDNDYEKIKSECYSEIEKIKLKIQPAKEESIFFSIKSGGKLKSFDATTGLSKKLQYLGFEFDGQNSYIRSSSLSRYYRRMKENVALTVTRAYGDRARGNKIFLKRLQSRFTHLGKKNFITYGLQAAKKFKSSTIKYQLSNHMNIFENALKEKVRSMEAHLLSQGKFKKSKLTQRADLISWENVKGLYVTNHLAKPLVQPSRRLNSLNRIENILRNNYPHLLVTPKDIVMHSKEEFGEMIRKNKASLKLSQADESVIEGLFLILL